MEACLQNEVCLVKLELFTMLEALHIYFFISCNIYFYSVYFLCISFVLWFLAFCLTIFYLATRDAPTHSYMATTRCAWLTIKSAACPFFSLSCSCLPCSWSFPFPFLPLSVCSWPASTPLLSLYLSAFLWLASLSTPLPMLWINSTLYYTVLCLFPQAEGML